MSKAASAIRKSAAVTFGQRAPFKRLEIRNGRVEGVLLRDGVVSKRMGYFAVPAWALFKFVPEERVDEGSRISSS